tara:strand:+ start:357 stop:659 length:303 start_codon:yes stop_codon:yes gene_type:complete
MLFQVNWEIYGDKKNKCSRIFSQMREDDDVKDHGDKIKIIGRWHRFGGKGGVCICETDDEKELCSWLQNWQSMCHIEVYPVVNDKDARDILNGKLSTIKD